MRELIKKCDKCQRFGNVQRLLAERPTTIVSPQLFVQWKIDIVSPLPRGKGQVKFLLVDINYFTKRVEVEALSTIAEEKIQSFIQKNIICRFGIPWTIISDNGRQFDSQGFRDFCSSLRIKNQFSSPRHSQENGQTEVTNQTLLKIIKARLGDAKRAWPEELPNVLWAYRTTARTPTGENPFQIHLRHRAVISIEVGITSIKREIFHEYYNKRVKLKRLDIGDLVLCKVTPATKDPAQRKLGPTQEGPYQVVHNSRQGSYHLETFDRQRLPRPWNIKHLKKYHQ